MKRKPVCQNTGFFILPIRALDFQRALFLHAYSQKKFVKSHLQKINEGPYRFDW
jgi:hypothetical protein